MTIQIRVIKNITFLTILISVLQLIGKMICEETKLEIVFFYPSTRHTKTYFWDVQDLENITLKWMYQSTETSIDHNLYIIGPWVFQSNYEAGLRILYFDDEQEDVVETGYFDVLPDRTTITFSGTWSNYPWYTDGKLWG